MHVDTYREVWAGPGSCTGGVGQYLLCRTIMRLMPLSKPREGEKIIIIIMIMIQSIISNGAAGSDWRDLEGTHTGPRQREMPETWASWRVGSRAVNCLLCSRLMIIPGTRRGCPALLALPVADRRSGGPWTLAHFPLTDGRLESVKRRSPLSRLLDGDDDIRSEHSCHRIFRVRHDQSVDLRQVPMLSASCNRAL